MVDIIVAGAKGQTITTRKRRVSFTTNTFLTLAFIITLFLLVSPVNAQIVNGQFTGGSSAIQTDQEYVNWYFDCSGSAYGSIIGTSPFSQPTNLGLITYRTNDVMTVSQNVDFTGYGQLNFYVAPHYPVPQKSYLTVWIDNDLIYTNPNSITDVQDRYYLVSVPVSYTGTHTLKFRQAHGGWNEDYNVWYIDDVSLNGTSVPPSTEIWYTSTSGVKINWNYSSWLLNNSNYGIPIKAYIWENSTSGNKYHSDDMLAFGSSLAYGSVNAEYPDIASNSSLYLIFLENNEYISQFVGSATWAGGGIAAENETDYTLPTPPENPPINLPDWLNGTAPPTNFSLPELLRPTGNFSAVNSYLDFIDNVFSPIRTFTFAVANFILSPISYITDYINKTTEQFNEIANSIVNSGFLAEVVRPFMMAIPTKISMLIAFSLLLSIIAYLLRYR